MTDSNERKNHQQTDGKWHGKGSTNERRDSRHHDQKKQVTAPHASSSLTISFNYLRAALLEIKQHVSLLASENTAATEERSSALQSLNDELKKSSEQTARIKQQDDSIKDLNGLIKYLEDKTGDDALQKMHQLENELRELKEQKELIIEKAINTIVEINGDVGSFSESFIGQRIYQYPESDEIVLSKSNPDEIRLYDLMGFKFPPDMDSLRFKVAKKGWCDNSGKVWIEAKLSILE